MFSGSLLPDNLTDIAIVIKHLLNSFAEIWTFLHWRGMRLARIHSQSLQLRDPREEASLSLSLGSHRIAYSFSVKFTTDGT